MESLDLELLRKNPSRAAWKSKQVRVAILVAIISLVVGAGHFYISLKEGEPLWLVPMIQVVLLAIIGGIGCYWHRKIRKLVEIGAPDFGTFVSRATVTGKIDRLVFAYEFDGERYEQITNVAGF